jgi:hypothetical protein
MTYEYEDNYYSDWKSDHITDLRKEFCELFQDEFEKYCREQCKEARDNSDG